MQELFSLLFLSSLLASPQPSCKWISRRSHSLLSTGLAGWLARETKSTADSLLCQCQWQGGREGKLLPARPAGPPARQHCTGEIALGCLPCPAEWEGLLSVHSPCCLFLLPFTFPGEEVRAAAPASSQPTWLMRGEGDCCCCYFCLACLEF